MSNSNSNKPIADSQSSGKKDEIINYILKAMEARVDEVKGNIDTSQRMLPFNVDTDLISSIKKLISDPLSQLMPIKQDVDTTIGGLITHVVKQYLLLHKDKIQKAIIVDTGSNSHELHFWIVLTEDNSDNRAAVYSLLADYKATDLWETYPIYFQIVPQGVADKTPQKAILVEA